MNSQVVAASERLVPAPVAYSAKQLTVMLGVSLRHIRRLQAAGKLPRPIRLGRSVRWSAEAIHEWLRRGAA